MFTSRAEYRLLFNHGSAELRYLNLIRDTSLLSESRKSKIHDKIKTINLWIDIFNTSKFEGNKTFGDMLRMGIDDFLPDGFKSVNPEVKNEVFYKVKYEGYLKRELQNISKMKNLDNVFIPDGLSFVKVPGLRIESAEKLSSLRPDTIGQASRIPGINPSDINVLSVIIKQFNGR
jgi:tRNA uridine 5-carboxymethylaminomethyl modification enzyme